RDRIFRFTAHELKSPITTLKSTLSVLNSIYADKIDEEARNLLRRAEQRADQILDMVKDMIEITRYRRTEEEVVKLEKVDFCKWLDDILESQKVFAKSKGVEFEIGPVSCAMVVIDTNSLSKIAINLVNNAVRYTPTGGKVTVTPFVNQREYGIIVSDTGIGIARDEIDKVFEEFYRAKNAKEVERLGTGLGLSLVKQIVERLGGDIKVESRLGEGSKFTVTLPFSS
ncbi:MAG: HAMP domain-containing histidine kinase, partial [Candidatus Marinimicrobia bacterium]|nr:HAMP domain-containing histidine kinase [Candidatus Neomarinimicrobiota bacterium]